MSDTLFSNIIKENPDSIYSRGYDPRSFLIYKDYAAYISTDKFLTHGNILRLIVMKWLPKTFAMLPFYTRDEVYLHEKQLIETTRPPKELLDLLEKNPVIQRTETLNSLNRVILGRVSLASKEVSFWNKISQLGTNEIKQTITILKGLRQDPAKCMYEFDDMEPIPYKEFIKNVPSETSPHVYDTDHILHTMSPEKKGDAMKAQGMKPKAAKGVEQRFAMGEGFKSFFDRYIIEQTLTENFNWDDLRHTYKLNIDDNTHRIDIHNKSGAVGYIEWDIDSGEVDKIYVGKNLRRIGLGTYLWELATDWATENKQQPPEHSSRRSHDGEMFAQSIGGYIPSLTDDIDGWTTR